MKKSIGELSLTVVVLVAGVFMASIVYALINNSKIDLCKS